jgi:hypothetical protein
MMTRFSQLRDRFQRLSAEEQEEVLALPAYLMSIEEHETALQAITHLDFMELKIRSVGISHLVSDYDTLCGALPTADIGKCLNAIRGCLVQSAHILQTSAEQLREQLLARLTTAQVDAFIALTGQTMAKSCPYLRPISNTLARLDSREYMIKTNDMPLRASLSENLAIISTVGGMEAWDIRQHDRLWCFNRSDVGFAFSLSADHVVASYGSTEIAFIEAANGAIVRTCARPSGVILGINIDQVHRLIILTYKDGRMAVVDMETGETTAIINAHPKEINDAAVAKNGSFLITASADGTLKVWALPSLGIITTMEEVHEYMDIVDIKTNIRSVDISPDARRAISAGWDAVGRYDISVWDMESHGCIKRIPAHKQFIECVRFVDDQRVLSASWDGTARLYDLATGKELRTFQGHSDCVLYVSDVDQDRFLTASKDGFVCLWTIR